MERRRRVRQYEILRLSVDEMAEREGVTTRAIRNDLSVNRAARQIALEEAATEQSADSYERLVELRKRIEINWRSCVNDTKTLENTGGDVNEIRHSRAAERRALRDILTVERAMADHVLGPHAVRVRMEGGGLTEGELAKRYGITNGS